MSLSTATATIPDLFRLVALPVFAYAAYRDVETRRIPGEFWIPVGALAALLLAWDGWVAWHAGPEEWVAFVVPAAISLGFVVPLAYLFWWFGAFGGADAKALFVIALLLPAYPEYVLGGLALPLEPTPIGSFAFSVLSNAVLVALVLPLFIAGRNGLAGRISGLMFLGWPISWEALEETHGKLLEDPDGATLSGLDLDAMRMYLRWRGLTLAELRADPDRYRDPESLPETFAPPTDGAVRTDGGREESGEAAGDAVTDTHPGPMADGSADSGDGELNGVTTEPGAAADSGADPPTDPWGAAAFLEDIEGSAYGTDPETLRGGLEVIASADRVWITPGTPFLVPIFLGMLVAFVYGDVLVALLF